MPRLDNGSNENLRILREWGKPEQWPDFDPGDPGKMPPMDVCRHCHKEYSLTGDVAHPSYADDYYDCAICANQLDEIDD